MQTERTLNESLSLWSKEQKIGPLKDRRSFKFVVVACFVFPSSASPAQRQAHSGCSGIIAVPIAVMVAVPVEQMPKTLSQKPGRNFHCFSSSSQSSRHLTWKYTVKLHSKVANSKPQLSSQKIRKGGSQSWDVPRRLYSRGSWRKITS